MKLRQYVPMAALLGGLLLSSCGKDPKALQAAALEGFKTEMKAVDAFMKGSEAAMKENPMGAFGKIKELVGKLEAVKTDLLPADLKEPFEKLRASTQKMVAAMGKLPFASENIASQADMQKWVQDKAAKDPAFMADFMSKMQAFQTEVGQISTDGDAAKDALQAAFDKYGIDVQLDDKKADAAPAAPAPAAAPTTPAPAPAAPAPAPAPAAPQQ